MSNSDPGPLAAYNSLTDRHLSGYFRNARTQRHLRKMGLVTKKGEVVSEQMFRLANSRKEHRRHVRELLAQAIVHKTLDMERARQVAIRQRLEEIAKKELVRRIREDEREGVGEKAVLPLLSPRVKNIRKSKSRHKNDSDDNEDRRPKSAHPQKEKTERIQSGKSTVEAKDSNVMYIDSQGLPVLGKYDLDSVDSQYLSGLSPQALRHFTMNMTNVDYQSGTSPYVIPAVDPSISKQSRSAIQREASAYSSPRSSRSYRRSQNEQANAKDEKNSYVLLTNTYNYDQDALHPPHPPISRKTKLETGTVVVLRYDGSHIATSAKDEPAQVRVIQQHCGGNTRCLFFGSISKQETFHFKSRRHQGYPFSLTLYVNGQADTRVSTCCEFKHKPNAKLGGKSGKFTFISAESGDPCYRCLAEKSSKRPKVKKKVESDSEGERDDKNTNDQYEDDFADQDDSSVSSKSSKELEEKESTLPETQYKIHVYTGKERGGGTDANVIVTLYGEMGTTKSKKLDRTGSNDFEIGNMDSFELKLPNVGQIQKLRISQDGSGLFSDWYLDKVEVETEDNGTYTFICSDWLSQEKGRERILKPYIEQEMETSQSHKPDEDAKSELRQSPEPKPVEEQQKKRPASGRKAKRRYILKIFTADKDNAGTDADVFVQLYGENNFKSAACKLDKLLEDDFERGSCGVYKVDCADIGEVNKIKVWHDGSGSSPEWFLEKILLCGPEDDVIFPCSSWLNEDNDNKKTLKAKSPKTKEPDATSMEGKSSSRPTSSRSPRKRHVNYKLKVYTGSKSGAGTDANVYVKLHGDKSISSSAKLDKSFHDDFEKGSTCTYKIKLEDVGGVDKIEIWHDQGGMNSAWFLEKIDLLTSGDEVEAIFPCNDWLDDNINKRILTKQEAPHVDQEENDDVFISNNQSDVKSEVNERDKESETNKESACKNDSDVDETKNDDKPENDKNPTSENNIKSEEDVEENNSKLSLEKQKRDISCAVTECPSVCSSSLPGIYDHHSDSEDEADNGGCVIDVGDAQSLSLSRASITDDIASVRSEPKDCSNRTSRVSNPICSRPASGDSSGKHVYFANEVQEESQAPAENHFIVSVKKNTPVEDTSTNIEKDRDTILSMEFEIVEENEIEKKISKIKTSKNGLTELYLKSCTFSNEFFTLLSTEVLEESSLRIIKIEDCCITGEEEFCDVLISVLGHQMKNLETLSLVNVPLKDSHWNELKSLLFDCRQTRSSSVNSMNTDDAASFIVNNVLNKIQGEAETFGQLKQLTVSKCDLGPQTMSGFLEFLLAVGDNLTNLDLSSNPDFSQCLLSFGVGVGSLSSLQLLDLSQDGITTANFGLLKNSLFKCSRLIDLRLVASDVSEEEISSIKDSMPNLNVCLN